MQEEELSSEKHLPKPTFFGDIITFFDNDIKGVQTPHNDAVVVFIKIAKHNVKKIK